MNNLSSYISSLLPEKEHLFVCFTGGGGKTTALKTLSEYFKNNGLSVLLTTTTKFQNPGRFSWGVDLVFTEFEKVKELAQKTSLKGKTVLYGSYFNELKYSSPPVEDLKELKELFDITLCEADGSRGLPFKVHCSSDPVIPGFCDFTIPVIGSQGALKKTEDVTFGLENLKREYPETADEAFISMLAGGEEGIFKGTESGKRALIINGADGCTQEQAVVFLNVKWPSDCAILFSSVQTDTIRSVIQEGKGR